MKPIARTPSNFNKGKKICEGMRTDLKTELCLTFPHRAEILFHSVKKKNIQAKATDLCSALP